MNPIADERGFTLIEAVVALAIVAAAASSLFATLRFTSQAVEDAEFQRHAASTAMSLLAEIGETMPLADGESQGTSPSGEAWTVQIAPMSHGDDRPAPRLKGHAITVSISRSGPRPISVQFQTIKAEGRR